MTAFCQNYSERRTFYFDTVSLIFLSQNCEIDGDIKFSYSVAVKNKQSSAPNFLIDIKYVIGSINLARYHSPERLKASWICCNECDDKLRTVVWQTDWRIFSEEWAILWDWLYTTHAPVQLHQSLNLGGLKFWSLMLLFFCKKKERNEGDVHWWWLNTLKVP